MTISNSVNAGELERYVESIKSLEEAKRQISEDIREMLQEAQSSGYEGHAIRSLVRRALMDEKKLAREKIKAETLALYANALQMDLPL